MEPVLQALLVADHVYQDSTTGKKIIAGIFHELRYIAREDIAAATERGEEKVSIPAAGLRAGSPFAYASLVDVRGEQQFILRYVDLSNDRVVFQCGIKANANNPLSPIEIVVPLPELPSNKPGVFALELLWNDTPLGFFRITVKEYELNQGEEDAI